MKIAHIAPPWITIPPKNYGGTEIVLYNLVEEQIEQGHDVTLLAPGDARTSAKLVSFFPRSLIESGVPWQGHLKAYYHLYKAVQYIKEHDFDIVHAHLSSAADMYVFPLTTHMTTPMVTTLHSCFPFDRVQSWKGDADKCYLEWLASAPMVAISESARAEVPHRLNFVGVVHHGIPIERFEPTAAPESFFAWLGRFVPEKGAHLAVKAAKKAGVPLVLAGTVDRHMEASVNYFNEVIKPLIDDQQIKYIGPVNMEQKIRLLSRACGFLNPIEWEEPFGMVMIEAMAVGCPVITFARGAAPEIVCHKKSGFLAHDVNEMAHFISRVKDLDRAAIRAYAKQYFSVSTMGNKYQRIYKKVIASSRRLVAPAVVSPKMRVPSLAPPSKLVTIDEPVQVPRSAALATATLEVEPQP
ncbi:MAG: glycosyltransferase family 4 protein [Ktedonobacteraceae bacterium]|nr:glycosyltransferase family 4 protein [Ktedonobacteraceae bacterium]